MDKIMIKQADSENVISYFDFIDQIRNQGLKQYRHTEPARPILRRVKSAPVLSSKLNYFDYIQNIRESKSDNDLTKMT